MAVAHSAARAQNGSVTPEQAQQYAFLPFGGLSLQVARALAAAKDPQLKMKLQNMPIPLTADMVDEYMRPVLEAARDGNLSIIKNV